ncbi:Rieske 2Fe-2S domain-containing protein [Paraburkholderia sp. ZP32-5]|uniref:Rieske 2Fe-2S domain-containing protein n=1 Tax=Paraburkholderia sp. ZP32-5 TaxID=2883245 RepID=UPI001F406ABC|nr:Rieske 2Fe-2S domain-containing protein [Paraburkholderia sp. ZP32-5]
MTNRQNWYPVARSGDLAPRHIFHGELQGVELALWRTDAGIVNAWENRCPHRSVRFTLGVNTGTALQCQYHGWRYRHGDGQCIYMPAATNGVAPPNACARPFAITEASGYVWASIDAAPDARPPTLPFVPLAVVLRSVVVHADEESVRAALKRYAQLDAGFVRGTASIVNNGGMVEAAWQSRDNGAQRVRFALQPAARGKTVIHASTERSVVGSELATRWHNRNLMILRRQVEETCHVFKDEPRYIPIAQVHNGTQRHTTALYTATVSARRHTSEDIVELRLALPAGVELPFEPGAHIDVHTPAGFVRQYSLLNAPHERREFVLGVKREPQSRGGSASIHDQVKHGDTLTVSAPKNHFGLSPAKGACLIAGGIGITPILAMAQSLQAQKRPYRLHYFARSTAHVAFSDRLDKLNAVEHHCGFDPAQTRLALAQLFVALPANHDVYVCGPKPLIDCAIELARNAEIAASRVHVERFANDVETSNDRPFRVRLAKSGTELSVPAGVSVATMLRTHGTPIDTSCEQGVCGTCKIGVLDGEPEHRDVYLTDAEKASGRCMMACVSRSQSALLVLDL